MGHMIALEQEEYKKEGIQWTFIDFGLDLAKTIELIEKPLGIMSLLEEECMFPKASDKTFKDKLYTTHLGKTDAFGKSTSKSKGQKEVDFELYHYAGTVGYNIRNWLNKNKDPLNVTVVELYRKSTLPMMQNIWADYKSAEELIEEEKANKGKGGKKKKGKGAAFMTVSAVHRESLSRLMTNLKSTAPHFVRCIVPNEHKKPGFMEPHLVLHQLRCNGVLEGIRICRKGFPNRILYGDFKARYRILNPNVCPDGEFMDNKEAGEKILTSLPVDQDKFRFGHTKIFFRAGFLAVLEEMRDEKLSKIFIGLQSKIRQKQAYNQFLVKLEHREAAKVIQANVRSFLFVKDWEWMKMMYKLKPLLATAEAAKEMDEVLEELEALKAKMDKESKKRKELEEANVELIFERDGLKMKLSCEEDGLADAEDRADQYLQAKIDLENKLKECTVRLEEEEELNDEMSKKQKDLDENNIKFKEANETLNSDLTKLEKEKTSTEGHLKNMKEELATVEDMMNRLNKEKRSLQEAHQQLMEDLQSEEDKVNNLTKLEGENKSNVDLERTRRKLEGDLRVATETILDLNQDKDSLEEKMRKNDFASNQLATKLEDEQSLVAQLQKKIKELQSRIEE